MSEVDRMETGLSETEKLVREHLGRIKALPIVVQILTRLSKELSPDLCYHSVEHTEEVLKEVVRYGVIDGLTNREIELLGIAAAYHDADSNLCGKNQKPVPRYGLSKPFN